MGNGTKFKFTWKVESIINKKRTVQETMNCNFEISDYETPAMRINVAEGRRNSAKVSKGEPGSQMPNLMTPRIQSSSNFDHDDKKPTTALESEVLIVDDNAFNIQTLEMLMKIKFKITVNTAVDG